MQWARKSIAAQIQQAQADYILSLKANHPTLFQQVDTWFQASRAADTLPLPSEHKIEAGHHRREIRSCWALPLDQLPPLYQAETWVGLQTIVIVERTRHLWNHTTHEVQFYLSSLPADSPRIAAAIRQHWGLKIPCIGLLMSPLVKMLVGFVLSMHLTISLSCVALPSIPSIVNPPLSAVSSRSRSGRRWMMPTCLLYWRQHYPNPIRSHNLAVNSF
jgi:predicted transposase YbfD/YdcC